MGPVAVVAPFVVGAAVIASHDDDHHEVVNRFVSSSNIGGALTEIKRTPVLR